MPVFQVNCIAPLVQSSVKTSGKILYGGNKKLTECIVWMFSSRYELLIFHKPLTFLCFEHANHGERFVARRALVIVGTFN